MREDTASDSSLSTKHRFRPEPRPPSRGFCCWKQERTTLRANHDRSLRTGTSNLGQARASDTEYARHADQTASFANPNRANRIYGCRKVDRGPHSPQRKLGWQFLDVDESIVQKAGMPVSEIFAKLGEFVFRRMETSAIAHALGERDAVVALGGGAVEVLANRLLLEQTPRTAVVFLDAALTTLLDRCQRQIGAAERPNLQAAEERFRYRAPLYRRVARLRIETSQQSPEESVQELRAAPWDGPREHSLTISATVASANDSPKRLRITSDIGEKPVNADLLQDRRQVRGYILFAFILLGCVGLAWKLHHVLLILYVSGLFAVVLTPIVRRIQRLRLRGKHIGKGLATVTLFAGIFIALGLFLWIGFPPVIRDFASFVSDLPHRIPQLLGRVQRLPFASKVNMSKVAAEAQNVVGATAAYVFDALPRWATHMFDLLTGVILCVYFILEGDEVYKYFLSLWPADRRTRLANTLQTAEERVSKWLVGQLLLMGAVAVYMLIVFGSLHVRYFVLLGILMGITNLIPIAGNLITITLAILIAASDSWTKALGVIIAYFIYVQLENAVLTPRIMKTSVDLMGITVLVALLCGTEAAGIVGALVAVPTAAMVVVFANEYLVQHDDDPERTGIAAS